MDLSTRAQLADVSRSLGLDSSDAFRPRFSYETHDVDDRLLVATSNAQEQRMESGGVCDAAYQDVVNRRQRAVIFNNTVTLPERLAHRGMLPSTAVFSALNAYVSSDRFTPFPRGDENDIVWAQAVSASAVLPALVKLNETPVGVFVELCGSRTAAFLLAIDSRMSRAIFVTIASDGALTEHTSATPVFEALFRSWSPGCAMPNRNDPYGDLCVLARPPIGAFGQTVPWCALDKFIPKQYRSRTFAEQPAQHSIVIPKPLVVPARDTETTAIVDRVSWRIDVLRASHDKMSLAQLRDLDNRLAALIKDLSDAERTTPFGMAPAPPQRIAIPPPMIATASSRPNPGLRRAPVSQDAKRTRIGDDTTHSL